MTVPHYMTQTGMNEQDEIDFLYMVVTSLKGICAKLDDDVLVTDTDYEALCYTAIINTVIYDSTGHVAGQCIYPTKDFNIIGPSQGISDRGRNALLFQLFTAFATLAIKLDADVGTTLTATLTTQFAKWRVLGCDGTYVGAGAYVFTPNGTKNQKELVDLYYAIAKTLETTGEQLDVLGGVGVTVTDTDYEALWFTVTILILITDSTGHTAGNN